MNAIAVTSIDVWIVHTVAFILGFWLGYKARGLVEKFRNRKLVKAKKNNVVTQ